jgi:hypothetical protein
MECGKVITDGEIEGMCQEAVVIYPDARVEVLRKTTINVGLRPGLELFEYFFSIDSLQRVLSSGQNPLRTMKKAFYLTNNLFMPPRFLNYSIFFSSESLRYLAVKRMEAEG